jgi:hypothetical protein
MQENGMELVTATPHPLQISLASSNAVAHASYNVENGGSYKVTVPSDSRWQQSSAKQDYSDQYTLTIDNSQSFAQSCPLELWRQPERNVVGLSAMFYNADGKPSAIPIQLSKNWHSYASADVPTGYGFTNYQGNWLSLSTVLHIPANTKVELTLVFAYAHYGGLPAASHAQLSLIGWGGGGGVWHESALGSFGEQICYQPSGQSKRSMVTDMRPLHVCGMGSDPSNTADSYSSSTAAECKKSTWTHNAGGADFLVSGLQVNKAK